MTRQFTKPLKLDISESAAATVVHVSGSVDMTEAEKMRIALIDVAAKPVPLIIMDLGDMDFICSLGLGAIICGHLKTRHHQGEIRLVNPQPAVREMLEATRLTKLFHIYPTVESAMC